LALCYYLFCCCVPVREFDNTLMEATTSNPRTPGTSRRLPHPAGSELVCCPPKKMARVNNRGGGFKNNPPAGAPLGGAFFPRWPVSTLKNTRVLLPMSHGTSKSCRKKENLKQMLNRLHWNFHKLAGKGMRGDKEDQQR
jgi:hypothetical protein